MIRGRKVVVLLTAATVVAAVLCAFWYRQYQSEVLAENKQTSDRFAEVTIMALYAPSVELAGYINGSDIFGSWTAEDLEPCVLMPQIQPCKKRVRLVMTARDRKDHHQVLVLAPTWIVYRDFTEEPENDQAKNLFVRTGRDKKSDPFAAVRQFADKAVSPTHIQSLSSIMFDVSPDRPVTSFFLPRMFRLDPTCPNCYLVRFLLYLDGKEYEGIFRINLDTDYIEGVNDTANDSNVFYVNSVSWHDESAARKIIFDSYYPNFHFPVGDDKYDHWEFRKSPSCKKCFYVARQINQPIGPSSYRSFDCKWEVNVETGVSEPLTSETRIAFRLAGTRNPFETEHGNTLEER